MNKKSLKKKDFSLRRKGKSLLKTPHSIGAKSEAGRKKITLLNLFSLLE